MSSTDAGTVLGDAAAQLQALAPAVLSLQLGSAVAADHAPPLPGLHGRVFQLPMHLAQDLPVRLQLWLPDGLLAQLAATWNHEVSSTDIGCELANVLAGRLLMQRATAGAQGHMGLPRDGGATAAPQAAQGWWHCAPHGLHLALLPETGS